MTAAIATPVGPSWLLEAKLMPPPLPAGYLPRATLLQQVEGALRRRLTVLQAPAGFGKTTLLADLSRTKSAVGIAVGWLSVDEDDTPEVFGNYLARAIQDAGVDFAALSGDVWASSDFTLRFGSLARAVEAHAAPCLLALDEVERLPRPTVELLDRFVNRSPPNLHFAVALRANPGLDLVSSILDGSAVCIDVEQLRFSKPEIARFYGGSLSASDMARIGERTAGWPVALMIDRNARTRVDDAPGGPPADLSANFLGVRLLRGISGNDRALLLDLAVFDWIDADVVDEVLGSSDARLRVSSLRSLDGLLVPMDAEQGVLRLHPLVREYCLSRLAAEDPARKRFLHGRIGTALARRGHYLLAWRHAGSAGDERLIGALIEQFGVLEMWLQEGVGPLEAASAFLTPGITDAYPRLALLRCVTLHFQGRFEEAAALYQATGERTGGFTRDREGGDDEALAIDRVFVEAALAGAWRATRESGLDAVLPAGPQPDRPDRRYRTIVGGWHLLRCIYSYQFADFQESREHASRAGALFAGDMKQGEFFATVHLGMAAMAQGRVPEALDAYTRARQLVRKHFPADRRLMATGDLLLIELDLERNRQQALRQRTLQDLTDLSGVWNEVFAMAVSVRAELTFQQYESDDAIRYLERAMGVARASVGEQFGKYVALLLALYLARAGRVGEADRLWSDEALPSDEERLMAVDGRSWRFVEAQWCSRATVLLERGEPGPAGRVADAGWRVASKYGITRVALHCLGLSMAAAHRAGREGMALERLAEALRLTRDADYYRALASHGEVSRVLLEELLATSPEPLLREAAESALRHLGERAERRPEFSPRELDVLSEVRHGLRNREIADFLSVTEEAVRFHLRNIYRKVGVSERTAAVRYAEGKGLLA